MADNELLTEFKLFLSEKGLAGTDASFKSPVVTSDEYHSTTKKLREQYGKKRRPWEKKVNPFKDPIKKLEEEQSGKDWDKFIDRLDKIKDPEKRKFEEYKWQFEKWYFDTLKKQGSKVRRA